MILLATSNVVFAEDYQLPATVNNPVVMPVGADEFQNGVKNAIIKESGTGPAPETSQATKPTTELPSLSPASSASPAVNEITGALSKTLRLSVISNRLNPEILIVTEDRQGKSLNKMHKAPGPLQKQMSYM
jgi:conjugal transfer pilus assembly protein TraK